MRFPLRLWSVVIASALIVGIGSSARAQLLRPPAASVTARLAADGVHPGSSVRALLQVRLPDGLHVNSNKPRDPSLIPVVLTVEAPAGVSVEELVDPDPIDLVQQGADQPLAVYEREFAIGVQLRVADDVRPGALAVPARLRYQACDERLCYLPATVSTTRGGSRIAA